MPQHPIPEPIIIPLKSNSAIASQTIAIAESPTDIRWLRVEEFLQARSLQPKSCKAYQRDLQLLVNWTDTGWNQVTRRQVAFFPSPL